MASHRHVIFPLLISCFYDGNDDYNLYYKLFYPHFPFPSSVDFPLFLLGLFNVYVKPFNITQVVVITLKTKAAFYW